VGTAGVLSLLGALSMVMYAVEGRDKNILRSLALLPSEVRSGEIWRIFTWPLANGLTQSLFGVAISVAMLWYFGGRLEAMIGRVRSAVLLATVIVVPGLLGTALDLPAAGMRSISMAVLLIFIAEYPQMRFFFGIPAWVLGVAYVVIEALQIMGDFGTGRQLLFYLLSLVVAALAARSVGLLTAYPQIPRIPLPAALSGVKRRPTSSGPTRGPRPPRQAGSRSSNVVDGPWTPPPPPSRSTPDAKVAQEELDGLLDKISATGLDSLSAEEKRRLNELSKRLR
jgi:membrane associated rhomboid family serine protease